jgi:plasmid stability protein
MSTQQVSLNLPDTLYQHLKRQAEQARRSVEEETLEVLLTAVVPAGAALAGDLAEVLQSLQTLDDPALWNAARGRLAADVSAELEDLHHKRQREGLAEAEAQRLADLVRQYERHLLVRAQAAALLRQHGHDVSELLAS